MPQAGFTPIQTYNSPTAGHIPVYTDLYAGELAINTTDEKLYFKNTGGTVKLLASTAVFTTTGSGSYVLATSPTITGHPTIEGVTSTGATGTGKFVFDSAPTITGHPTIEGVTSTGATGTGKFVFDSSPTLSGVTLSDGTANGVAYLNSSKVLTSGSGLVYDSSGNLGLGVVPSGWGGSCKALQFGNGVGASVLCTTNSSNTYIGNNFYFDGSVNRYVQTNSTGLFGVEGNSFRWYTAPSGTAGNAISFTNVMTLDSSGNLLVGTTTGSYQITCNKMAYLGGITQGVVRGSGNNNYEACLLHKLGVGAGFQYSGKIIICSYTGQAYVDVNVTARYDNDGISCQVLQASTLNSPTKTNLDLVTLTYNGDNYVAILKNGGGTGNLHLHGFNGSNVEPPFALTSGFVVTSTVATLN